MRIRLTEAEFTDQCAVVEEVADELPALYHEVTELHDALARDGFPTSSSGAGEGGATNIVFPFPIPNTVCPDCSGRGCGECYRTGHLVELLTVPQHSDPVGEQVASDASEPWANALNQAAAAGRSARLAVSEAQRDLERACTRLLDARKGVDSARGALERARKPPPAPPAEPLGNAWCWNCGRWKDDTGETILTPMYRIGPEPADGTPARARCRHCYDWRRDAELIRTGEHPHEPADPAWPLEQPAALVLQRALGKRVYLPDIRTAVDDDAEHRAHVARQGVEAHR